MISRLRWTTAIRTLTWSSASPSEVVCAVTARHQIGDWDQAWPDLDVKRKVILDCMNDVKIPVPSAALASITSPSKLSEYFTEQAKALAEAEAPVQLPPNLKFE